MDNKIGSIDNDGNVTSNTYDDYNDMTTTTEASSFESENYTNTRVVEDYHEEFDVFGN